MELKNPLYKNIGIHVICSLFTVDNGDVKVLLIKRKNEPFKNKWALVGGALYNNETIEDGLRREIFEKTGLENINLYLSNIERINLLNEEIEKDDKKLNEAYLNRASSEEHNKKIEDTLLDKFVLISVTFKTISLFSFVKFKEISLFLFSFLNF